MQTAVAMLVKTTRVTTMAIRSNERESQDAGCETSALNARNKCNAFEGQEQDAMLRCERTNALVKPLLRMRNLNRLCREIHFVSRNVVIGNVVLYLADPLLYLGGAGVNWCRVL